ncbi:MAG: CoA transferase [candidate division Zixibacteria bacterium]|nr:CoA transferase [candidate division Zixibacteria bacterium]
MQPLHGLRVIDLTRVLAGPYATMILADLGAEVVKIESPEGDESRGFGPFKNGVSGYFQSVNRGKKSVTLDLKHPDGVAILKRLIHEADILVENFRPGAMKRLGLDYETLRTEHPALIYAACSGFGHTGPMSQEGAYDMIIQGMGGVVSITGEPDRPPVRVGVSISDLSAALFTVVGILTALHTRHLTGCGQFVDIAMLDCQVALLENAIARYDMTGITPGPLGSRHPSITPFQALRTRDAWIMVAIGNNRLWRAFCETLELPNLIHDQRFSTNERRTENHSLLEPMLNEVMTTRTSAEWLTALHAHDIPCGPIQSVDEVMTHPQVLARDMIRTILHPVAGPLRMPGSPVKLSDFVFQNDRAAPAPGEHTGELLTSLLSLHPSELERLRRDHVIG